MNKMSGAVLPLTLVILAILTIMALTLTQKSNGYLDQAIEYKKQWQAEIQIHNAEQRVLLTLISGHFSPGSITLGNTNLPIYSEPYVLSNDVEVKVQDEAGLINILHASSKTVVRLLNNLGYSEQATDITNEAFAWQSPLRTIPVQLPLSARNLPFRSEDELLELPSMKPDYFNGKQDGTLPIKDYLLVSGPGWMNYAAMPEQVLTATLSLNLNELDRIKELRARNKWDELKPIFRGYGMYGEGLEFSPSPNFIVNFSYKGYRAKGSYKMLSASHYLYEKRIWNFPKQDRF
ncbi:MULTISPECIES: hypothetical protein [unclassified Motilimonas]|uniref:hypothetical protein n=1 Tax=unclassified Motilimonas TaxID=2643697 RepID=UPI001E4AD720|nr:MULTISPECIES: hypothetical protein [unclassified Motilimonas]MCE0558532.1 hypothetical protein [Motilimonas sp. E26]MDO6527419.1 hypothetical protein [Motilimonas sp. 1_MG-2023]